MNRRAAGWLAAAGACAGTSLGLPWSPLTTGAGAPLRVFVALAAVLVVAGLRTRRDRLLSLAVPVALAGVLVGGPAPTPSQLALAVAAGCLVRGLRIRGRSGASSAGPVRAGAGGAAPVS